MKKAWLVVKYDNGSALILYNNGTYEVLRNKYWLKRRATKKQIRMMLKNCLKHRSEAFMVQIR